MHHVITFALCLAPLFRPELAYYAALDGLTEINTFFLILRRQWKSKVCPSSRPSDKTGLTVSFLKKPRTLALPEDEHGVSQRYGVALFVSA